MGVGRPEALVSLPLPLLGPAILARCMLAIKKFQPVLSSRCNFPILRLEASDTHNRVSGITQSGFVAPAIASPTRPFQARRASR